MSMPSPKIQQLKSIWTKYSSPINACLFSDSLDRSLLRNLITSGTVQCWLSKNEWKVPPVPNTDWLFFPPLPWSQYCRGTVIFEVKNILGGYLFKEKKIGRRRIIAYLFPNFWSPLLRVFGDNIVQRKILWKYCTEEILITRHVMYLRIPGFNKNYGKYIYTLKSGQFYP